MSDNTIKVGDTVQTTRDLRPVRPDKPVLRMGSIGTVTSIQGSYAAIVFDFGRDAITKMIPLDALALLDRPFDLAQDWNLIANIQRDPISNELALNLRTQARFYDPRVRRVIERIR